MPSIKGKDIHIAGMVSNIEHRFTKGGKPFGTLTLEDYLVERINQDYFAGDMDLSLIRAALQSSNNSVNEAISRLFSQ